MRVFAYFVIDKYKNVKKSRNFNFIFYHKRTPRNPNCLFIRYSRGQVTKGCERSYANQDGQPIEARPGFFLHEMGQNSLTRIGNDATTKIADTKFKVLVPGQIVELIFLYFSIL